MNDSEAATRRDVYEYDATLALNTAPGEIGKLIGHGKRLLEVGCGPGTQTRLYRELLGCTIVALEIDATRAAMARKYCENVFVLDVETASLPDSLGEDRFDVIVCADVLEHLRNPADALRRLLGFLTPGGYVVASVPNVTHASVVYEMARGHFEYRSCGLLDETHVHFFCRRTALTLFHSAGLAVAELHYIRKAPAETEFETAPETDDELRLLRSILNLNPDGDAYQFILKGYPALDSRLGTQNALLLDEQLRALEGRIQQQQREISRLQNAIAWLESRQPMRIYKRIRSSFARRTVE